VAHVFISYKREDKPFVLELKQQLIDADFEVWIDENISPGRKWRDELDAKLRESFALALVVSPESMTSEYVTYEWIYALGARVEVMPIYLRSIEKFPYRLEDFQYVDFRTRYPWGLLFHQLRSVMRQEIPEAVKQAVTALDNPNANERKSAIESLAQTRHEEA